MKKKKVIIIDFYHIYSQHIILKLDGCRRISGGGKEQDQCWAGGAFVQGLALMEASEDLGGRLGMEEGIGRLGFTAV